MITGMTGTCAVCISNIYPHETIKVHDQDQHPVHTACYDKWKERCRVERKDVTCVSCRKFLEVVPPIIHTVAAKAMSELITTVLREASLPSALMADDFSIYTPPYIPIGNQVGETYGTIWKRATKANNDLNRYDAELNQRYDKLPIALRKYLNDNIGVPGAEGEVREIVNRLNGHANWTRYYAIKTAAAKGCPELAFQLVEDGSRNEQYQMFAFAFITNVVAQKWNDARTLLNLANTGTYGTFNATEGGDGLRHFARTGVSGGARLLLEQGSITLIDRIKAIKSALYRHHVPIAKEIFTSQSVGRSSTTVGVL